VSVVDYHTTDPFMSRLKEISEPSTLFASSDPIDPSAKFFRESGLNPNILNGFKKLRIDPNSSVVDQDQVISIFVELGKVCCV